MDEPKNLEEAWLWAFNNINHTDEDIKQDFMRKIPGVWKKWMEKSACSWPATAITNFRSHVIDYKREKRNHPVMKYTTRRGVSYKRISGYHREYDNGPTLFDTIKARNVGQDIDQDPLWLEDLPLTPMEKRIVYLLTKGYMVKEISEDLEFKSNTIFFHLAKLRNKLKEYYGTFVTT